MVVLIFFSKYSRFFCVLSGKEVFTVLRSLLNGFIINAVRLAMLLLRVRFAATCHNGGQIDAKALFFYHPAKLVIFMRLTKLERAVKRFRGNVLYDLLNILFYLKEESSCEGRVQKANHVAESADKRKDFRVCTFKKRKKNGKRFLSYQIFPELYPRTG